MGGMVTVRMRHGIPCSVRHTVGASHPAARAGRRGAHSSWVHVQQPNKVPGPGLGVLFVHVGYVTGKLPHYGAHLAHMRSSNAQFVEEGTLG